MVFEYAGRITKGAALGMKARVLLYAGRWEEAAIAKSRDGFRSTLFIFQL